MKKVSTPSCRCRAPHQWQFLSWAWPALHWPSSPDLRIRVHYECTMNLPFLTRGTRQFNNTLTSGVEIESGSVF